MQKEELRAKFKAERNLLYETEVMEKSRAIINNLIDSLDWQRIKAVHVYDSINSLNEVRTAGLISILKTSPSLQITIASRLPRPLKVRTKFDLIIVPVLAFDNNGYRLGMGGGWYDRFLATQPQALKVGLAYSEFKIDNLPHETHDIKLDKIITEDGPAF